MLSHASVARLEKSEWRILTILKCQLDQKRHMLLAIEICPLKGLNQH